MAQPTRCTLWARTYDFTVTPRSWYAPHRNKHYSPYGVCRTPQQAGHLCAANVKADRPGSRRFKGTPPNPRHRKDDLMETKNKEPPRIAFRVTEKEKAEIIRLSKKCGLSYSEYSRQRALGYEPRAVLPDAFFIFCEKLDALTSAPFSKEVNKAALKLIRDMDAALISPGKEDMKLWLPRDSGPSEES